MTNDLAYANEVYIVTQISCRNRNDLDDNENLIYFFHLDIKILPQNYSFKHIILLYL